jgi:hypothetical protein
MITNDESINEQSSFTGSDEQDSLTHSELIKMLKKPNFRDMYEIYANWISTNNLTEAIKSPRMNRMRDRFFKHYGWTYDEYRQAYSSDKGELDTALEQIAKYINSLNKKAM